MITGNFCLLIAALIITVVCAVIAEHNRNFFFTHYRIYIAMLLDLVVCSFFAIISQICERLHFAGLNPLRFASETGFHMMLSLSSFLVLIYFLVIFDAPVLNKKRNIFFMNLLILVLEVLYLVNIPFRFFFTVEGPCHYSKSFLWPIIPIVSAIYLITTFFYVIYHHKALSSALFGFLMLAFSFTLAGTVIQILFYNIGVELFMISITSLIILFTVENTRRSIDQETGVFNRQELLDKIHLLNSMNIPFHLIDVRVISRGGSWDFLNDEQKRELNRKIANRLKDSAADTRIFNYSMAHFVLLVYYNLNNHARDPKEISRSVRSIISKPVLIGEQMIESMCAVTRIHCPKDAASDNELAFFLAIDSSLIIRSETEDHSTENVRIMRRIVRIQNLLNEAIEKNRIQVAFQPIYCVETKQAESCEAFLRFSDPVLGEVKPEEVIRIAEHSGMISSLEEKIFQHVCRSISEDFLPFRNIHSVQLNLSNYQLMEEDLADSMAKIAADYHLKPELFMLEIHEDEFLRRNPELKLRIRELGSAGFKVLLDNFGVTSNNIVSLLTSDVRYIKIDRRLLWEAMREEDRGDMLRIFISSMKSKQKTVFITGIETSDELAFSEETSCDFVQGYFLQEPVRLDDFRHHQENYHAAAL